MDLVPADDVNDRLLGLTDNTGCSPIWFTANVLVGTPTPVTVIKPALTNIVVLGVQVTQTVSVKLPVVLFKVICASASVTVQLVLEFIKKYCLPPAAVKLRDTGAIVKNPEAPIWEIFMVLDAAPTAEIVTTPVLLIAEELASQITFILPLFVPERESTLIKFTFSWTVQFVLAVIVPLWVPPTALNAMVAGVTFNRGTAPTWETLIIWVSKPGEAILIRPDLGPVELFD